MNDRFWVVSNYNYDPSLLIDRLKGKYVLCQQGNFAKVPTRLQQHDFQITKHSGHNLSDYLQYIIENYSNLPDELGLAKGNMLPRHIEEHVFMQRIQTTGFIPLYSDNKTYDKKMHRMWKWSMVAQQVAPGYYLEITNDWYVKRKQPGVCFPKLADMFKFITDQPLPQYIPFVPGACMIVPKENILRWPLELYTKLYEAVTYRLFPVEAYHLERCMLYLFCFPKM